MKPLKFGSITFDVFETKDGRVGFRYKSGSRWQQCIRTDLAKLRADAERIALSLLNAETKAIDVTAEDRRIYISARELLAPLHLQLDAVARDVAEAHRISGGIPLRDLALFHKRNHIGLSIEKKVEDVVSYVVAEIKERNLSDRFTRDIENDGIRVAAWFAGRFIADISAEEILAKIREHQLEKQFGWVRRNHLRDSFSYIWNVAQRMSWLPQDRDTAATRVARLKRPRTHSAVAVFTPDEMRWWIGNIKADYLPWLLLCGFSLVRSEEVAPEPNANKDRVRWTDFNWPKKYLRIRREVSKVGEPRNVPLPDNLIAWLAPFRERVGFVCAGEQPSKRETSRLSALAEEKGLPYRWKKNALRHTAISVELGIKHDRARVAEEAGTSESRIRRNYNEGFDEEQALEYRAIMPDYASGNILPLWQHTSSAKA